MELLAPDAAIMGDGGGKAPSIREPLVGSERVAQFLVDIRRRLRPLEGRIQPVEINGQPGAIVSDKYGGIISVLSLDIADGQVQAIRGVLNPDKLRHIGPVADLQGLLREAQGSH